MNYDYLKTFSTGLHSSPMLLIIEVINWCIQNLAKSLDTEVSAQNIYALNLQFTIHKYSLSVTNDQEWHLESLNQC